MALDPRTERLIEATSEILEKDTKHMRMLDIIEHLVTYIEEQKQEAPHEVPISIHFR